MRKAGKGSLWPGIRLLVLSHLQGESTARRIVFIASQFPAFLPSSFPNLGQKLVPAIRTIHAHRHTRAYGSPRMTRQLRAEGHQCPENRVARLMRREGLRARPRKPFRPKTTRPDHTARPSPNPLAECPPPDAPGQQIVSDITCIPTREGWLDLAVVIDLFSRSILGWKLGENLGAQLATPALLRALDSGLVAPNALFHSDRGSQYSAASTRAMPARAAIRQSHERGRVLLRQRLRRKRLRFPQERTP